MYVTIIPVLSIVVTCFFSLFLFIQRVEIMIEHKHIFKGNN